MINLTPSMPTSGTPNEASSVFALLGLIQDPAAYQTRLKELTDQANETAKWVEQAKAENLANQEAKKAAEEALSKATEAQRIAAQKEGDLYVREQKLAQGHVDLATQVQAHEAAKALWQQDADRKAADMYQRNQALLHAEQDHASTVKQTQQEMDQTLAAKLKAIEDQHRQRLDNAKALEASAVQTQADAKARAISAAKAAAEQARVNHEARLAELRSLGA